MNPPATITTAFSRGYAIGRCSLTCDSTDDDARALLDGLESGEIDIVADGHRRYVAPDEVRRALSRIGTHHPTNDEISTYIEAFTAGLQSGAAADARLALCLAFDDVDAALDSYLTTIGW